MAFVRAFFAVLASILTLGAVMAIKQGVEWDLRDWKISHLFVLNVVTVGPLIAAGVWLWLLRPRLLRRRQQREDAGLSHGRVGNAGGERVGAAAEVVPVQQRVEDARAAARRARQG